MSDKSNHNCSVAGCTNTYGKVKGRVPKVVFYSFPDTVKYDNVRRPAWIRFCARKNMDGSDWQPTKFSRICSEHFLQGRHVNNKNHPSYLPSIHPKKLITKPAKSTARFDRSQRRNKVKTVPKQREQVQVPAFDQGEWDIEMRDEQPRHDKVTHMDNQKGLTKGKMTMWMYERDGERGAMTQVSHEDGFKNDAATVTGLDQGSTCFFGMETVRKDGTIKELTSVPQHVFDFLLLLLKGFMCRTINTEDMLLIFLIKLKFALPFTTLAAWFGKNPNTVSFNFYRILDYLYERTQEMVYWPHLDDIKETMPECFKKQHSSCRVIIDCSEVKSEVPANLQKQNAMYSHYKSGHTIKFLVGITPNGMISFLSKCYGGRASDTYITNNSDFLEKLAPGDLVMADKGFPVIKSVKGVLTVIPPRASAKQKQFTTEEMEKTKSIASVRIHVERVIQRLKIFAILTNRYEYNLLPYVDKILHVCAVLVNLQAPIIKSNEGRVEEQDEEEKEEESDEEDGISEDF